MINSGAPMLDSRAAALMAVELSLVMLNLLALE
jgi:hypothetical protein